MEDEIDNILDGFPISLQRNFFGVINLQKNVCNFIYYNKVLYAVIVKHSAKTINDYIDSFDKSSTEIKPLYKIGENSENEDKIYHENIEEIKKCTVINYFGFLDFMIASYSRNEATKKLFLSSKKTEKNVSVCGTFALEAFTLNRQINKEQSDFDAYGKNMLMTFVINVISTPPKEMEKIVDSMGLKFLQENIFKMYLSVNVQKKKFTSVIGLPSEVIKYLGEDGHGKLYGVMRELSGIVDNNEIIYLVEFFKNIETIHKTESLEIIECFKSFAEIICRIMKFHRVPMKSLLTYIYRQNIYYSSSLNPIPIALEYYDYISIADKNKIPVETFPQNLRTEHYFIVENTKFENDKSKENAFEKEVSSYKDLEYGNKKFCAVCPKSITDLINEGAIMHHCIGSYVDRIISGAKVFFIRKTKEPNVPFVDIEIQGSIPVQIKQKFDDDVNDPEIIEFVNEWIIAKQKEGKIE